MDNWMWRSRHAAAGDGHPYHLPHEASASNRANTSGLPGASFSDVATNGPRDRAIRFQTGAYARSLPGRVGNRAVVGYRCASWAAVDF